MELNQTAGQGTPIESEPVLDQAKEKAREAAADAGRKVSEELRTRADTTRIRTADTLDSVAQALTSSAQQLRTNNQATPGDYIERFGAQVRRASDYLRNTGTDDIVRNAEDIARRQPAVFLGGAFILGFLASRLVKSSSRPSGPAGSIPHDRSLVPQGSMWTDREASLSGFREPGGAASMDDTTDMSYTRQFGREPL